MLLTWIRTGCGRKEPCVRKKNKSAVLPRLESRPPTLSTSSYRSWLCPPDSRRLADLGLHLDPASHCLGLPRQMHLQHSVTIEGLRLLRLNTHWQGQYTLRVSIGPLDLLLRLLALLHRLLVLRLNRQRFTGQLHLHLFRCEARQFNPDDELLFLLLGGHRPAIRP